MTDWCAPGVIVVALAVSASAAQADEGWRDRLRACVEYARTGNAPHPDSGIATRPIADARAAKQPVCEPLRSVAPRGNDARGLALRAEAHEVLDPVLAFRDEDQWGPPDVWRGCASDGQEFRLLSMTQTTNAYFWLSAMPSDRSCSYLGS